MTIALPGQNVNIQVPTGIEPLWYEKLRRIVAVINGGGFDAVQKAGAPAATDLPAGTWGVINDTTGGQTWLCYNNSGTIRKVQLT